MIDFLKKMEEERAVLDRADMYDVLTNLLGFKMEERKKGLSNKFKSNDGNVTIVVNKAKNSNIGYLYFNANGDLDDKGNVITLVMRRMNLKAWEAKKVLKDFIGGFTETVNVTPKKDIEKTTEAEEFDVEKFTLREMTEGSLLDSRGLMGIYNTSHFRNTVWWGQSAQYFHGHENIVFLMNELGKKEPIALDYRYKMGNDSKKAFAPGSDKAKSFWQSNNPHNSEDLFIVENPIDAMSHYMLSAPNVPDVKYISTNGTVTQSQIEQLKEKARGRIYLGFDNDFVGYRFTLQVLEAFSDGELKVKVLYEENKDLKLQVDGTFLNLNFNRTLCKNSPTLEADYKDLMGLILSTKLGSRFVDAKACCKDFNDDLSESQKWGIPVVYDFNNTIGNVSNLVNFVGEEQDFDDSKKKFYTAGDHACK